MSVTVPVRSKKTRGSFRKGKRPTRLVELDDEAKRLLVQASPLLEFFHDSDLKIPNSFFSFFVPSKTGCQLSQRSSLHCQLLHRLKRTFKKSRLPSKTWLELIRNLIKLRRYLTLPSTSSSTKEQLLPFFIFWRKEGTSISRKSRASSKESL